MVYIRNSPVFTNIVLESKFHRYTALLFILILNMLLNCSLRAGLVWKKLHTRTTTTNVPQTHTSMVVW